MFLLLSFRSSFYILDIDLLSDTWFTIQLVLYVLVSCDFAELIYGSRRICFIEFLRFSVRVSLSYADRNSFILFWYVCLLVSFLALLHWLALPALF